MKKKRVLLRHRPLVNLSVDLMLRGSDLLNLKMSDGMNESGAVKSESKSEDLIFQNPVS